MKRSHIEWHVANPDEFPDSAAETGTEVPVRFIGEQHAIEDLGRIPSVSDWLSEMPMKAWMGPRSQLVITVEDIKEESTDSGKKSSKSAGKRQKK